MTHNDYRLVELLPQQQANHPQSNPKVQKLLAKRLSSHYHLWSIILSFPRLSSALGHVNYVLLSSLPCLRIDSHALVEP